MAITLDGTTGITAPAIDVATPVTTVDGGTGLSSFTSGGAMYATSTSALTTGTLPVASGGTGATALTANNVLLGNGTSAVQLVAPGSSGNVLTSNGTTWTSAAAGGGAIQTQLFTSPGTWTKPSTVTQVRVTVIAGGSGAGLNGNASYPGGTGGSSSFGSLISATGASGSPGPAGGTPGSGTVTTGTAIKTGAVYSPIPYIAPAYPAPYQQLFSSISGISGAVSVSGLGGAPTYPTSGSVMAGAAGSNGNAYYSTATGGLAIGICPVSAPVSVTVGTGGVFNPGVGNLSSGSGVGGVVVVEWVG